MKKILFIATVIFFTSCKKERISETANQDDQKKYSEIVQSALLLKAKDAVGLQMSVPNQTKGKKVSRPLISTGSGSINYIPNGCGEGTIQFRSEGTGNSTTLGFQKQVTTFCINPVTGQVIGPVGGIGTAADGDKLYYEFAGAGIDPATGLMYQEYVFTGGTGRFIEATGNMTLLYTLNTPTNYEYTGKGIISF